MRFTVNGLYTVITKSGWDKYLLATALLLFCVASNAKQSKVKMPTKIYEPKPITIIKMTSGSTQIITESAVTRDKTAVEKIPNAVSIEAGGKGIMYSVNFDRLLDSQWAIGAGYSFYSLGTADKGANMAVVPVYSNFYFTQEFNRYFVIGGLDIVNVQIRSNSANPTDQDKIFEIGKTQLKNSVIPIFLAGTGWELRSRSGFLFRATGYLTYLTEIQPWAGISVGGVY